MTVSPDGDVRAAQLFGSVRSRPRPVAHPQPGAQSSRRRTLAAVRWKRESPDFSSGPTGPEGQPGPPGPTGPAGADGAIGPEGPEGPEGPPGADGATGPAGPQGDPGPTGPTGPAGADGADGADGATGPSGAASAQTVTLADPAGTTSLAGVMMGTTLFGTSTPLTYTPTQSGKVLVLVTGSIGNNTLNDGAFVSVRSGTGASPAAGAALTGTSHGRLVRAAVMAAGAFVPFTVGGELNLTPGTPYWIDLALGALVGGTASIRDLAVTIVEY